MKKLVFLILGTIFLQGCLSDLRPKYARTPTLYTEESHQKGVELLNKYAELSGVIEWQKIKSYQVDFADNFLGFKGKFAHPYPQKNNRFLLRYNPSKTTGALEFRNGGKKGIIWGYDEGKSYTKLDRSSPPVIKKSKAIQFWIPTYQYFIEFPFRISNADIIYHIGEKKYGLHNYDLVLVSWKSPAPQKKLDQYLLWINKGTGLVDKLQYTIRDQNGILKATTIISEHQNYNGIFIPGMFRVYLKENSSKPLHIMRVLNFQDDVFTPESLDLDVPH